MYKACRGRLSSVSGTGKELVGLAQQNLFQYLFIDFWLCQVFVALQGLPLAAIHGFPIVMASPAAESRLQSTLTQ